MLRLMPTVEFLTDDEAAAYGRYAGAPSQADLERVFFLKRREIYADSSTRWRNPQAQLLGGDQWPARPGAAARHATSAVLELGPVAEGMLGS